MREPAKELYIGDGLYVHDDGYQFVLRAPREFGDHYVALDDQVFTSFLDFVARNRKLKITVEKMEEQYENRD